MKHRVLAAAIAASAFLNGCAASLPEAKKEPPPGLSVRLPVAETATMNIESRQSAGRQELPPSVADETRGRWLVLFELNYTPTRPPNPLLPNLEEEPSR
ncbi:hypothetical protein [Candidatus Deferrimicrobium sp.]|uniref:hypothetical protein n=1 Tax=Candidatus Deferrimicrobium sp. TaxID=3060586 RepID=UPI002ED470F7